jgi:hypothetical protein
LFSIIPSSLLKAQSDGNLSLGVDLVSRYIWRGINLGGSSPHIQPGIEYSFGQSGLSVGAWGSYSLSLNAGAEADLYISYSPLDWLNFTLTDYFFPADQPFERNNYFNYKSEETGHTLEAMVTLGGFNNIPFYTTFAMNIYGADGINSQGNKYMAKYLEVGYSGNLYEAEYMVFAGAALDNPGTSGSGWYGDKAGLINLGLTISKSYNLLDKSIPVSSSLIFNPEAGNIYIVFGVTF